MASRASRERMSARGPRRVGAEAGGEVLRAEVRQRLAIQAGGHGSVVEDLAPDEDRVRRDAGRGGDVHHRGVAVVDVQRGAHRRPARTAAARSSSFAAR